MDIVEYSSGQYAKLLPENPTNLAESRNLNNIQGVPNTLDFLEIS